MRIIFSRKGFDSENGGMPNLILPDGTLLMLPIPSKYGTTKYNDIVYNGKTYYDIINELNPRVAAKYKDTSCHVDPDISNCYSYPVSNWKPAFGQCGASEAHLKQNNVKAGDIFLFYGWFRHTENDDTGKLQFVKAKNGESTDKHIIFAYMEIGDKITDVEVIKKDYVHHPHALKEFERNNALYIPAEKLSFNKSVNGCGLLNYSSIRQLTKEGHKRSEWALPECFKNVELTYHGSATAGWIDGNDYFKAVARGQEFVTKTDITEPVMEWVKSVIGTAN